MNKYKASELRALRSLGWKSNDIASILQLPQAAVEKEIHLLELEIEHSLLDENRINLLVFNRRASSAET
jgi:predicted transcriptional regulator